MHSPTYTAYTVGNQVSYNNVNYYVIENSDTTQATVKLLKAEPLTAEEIADYKPSEARAAGKGMQYHSSSNAYDGSYIKTTVDAWKAAKAPAATEARLIAQGYKYTEETPVWAYNSNYYYWTMSPYQESAFSVWFVDNDGRLRSYGVSGDGDGGVVRPVIVLSKSEISV